MKMEQRATPGQKAALTKRRKAAVRNAVDRNRRGAVSRKVRGGEQPLIPNSELRLFHVPPAKASIAAVHRFALTYDGYMEAGSGDGCAEIATKSDRATLHDIRTSLFFEQRRLRFVWAAPEDEAAVDASMRALVEMVRSKLKWSGRGTGAGSQVHRLDPQVYKRAIDFAAKAHGDQKVPGNGFPYVVHVAKVAMEVISATERDLEADRDLAVACALLHDTDRRASCRERV